MIVINTKCSAEQSLKIHDVLWERNTAPVKCQNFAQIVIESDTSGPQKNMVGERTATDERIMSGIRTRRHEQNMRQKDVVLFYDKSQQDLKSIMIR